MYLMNFIFLVSETVLACIIIGRFSNIQAAAFYRRTAPLIDRKFKKKIENSEAFRAKNASDKRTIQIGMVAYNK